LVGVVALFARVQLTAQEARPRLMLVLDWSDLLGRFDDQVFSGLHSVVNADLGASEVFDGGASFFRRPPFQIKTLTSTLPFAKYLISCRYRARFEPCGLFRAIYPCG
jgi:hypothetical protein